MPNLSEPEELVATMPLHNIACKTCIYSIGNKYEQYSKGTCEKYPVVKPTSVLFERKLCKQYESKS